MYAILVRLIIIAALFDLGLSAHSFNDCPSKQCLNRLQRASWKVIHIDWKPISVFPKEAKQFR